MLFQKKNTVIASLIWINWQLPLLNSYINSSQVEMGKTGFQDTKNNLIKYTPYRTKYQPKGHIDLTKEKISSLIEQMPTN